MNCFVIANPNKCIGCRTCMIACVVEHSDEEIFHEKYEYINFNPKLDVIKTEKVSVPVQCRHCEDALCAKVCANNAIKKVKNGIKIDEKNCIGCKTCMVACPFGAIDLFTLKEVSDDKLYFKEKMIANKCDLCMNSEDGPACVRVCPTKAFRIIKENDIKVNVKNKRKSSILI